MIFSKVEGQGIPLLVIHGFLGMSDNWKTFGVHFASLGFQVHLLDMRNHGKSFHSDAFNYSVMVDDVLEYIDANALDRVHLLGHSMGGKVAMKFALSHPSRMLKLVVADIAPRAYKPHHQEILAGLSAVDFSVQPSRKEVEGILTNYIQEDSTRQFLMKSLYWKQPGQLAYRFNLPVFLKDTEAIGEGLIDGEVYLGPTLFLKGALSNYIQQRDEADIANHFPNSKIVSISNSGHWLHAENPIEFQAGVQAFL